MPWIDNVTYAKTLDELSKLKEQVSTLLAMNANLVEKNKNLAVKLTNLVETGKDLHESTMTVLGATSAWYADLGPIVDEDETVEQFETCLREYNAPVATATIASRDALWRRQHEEFDTMTAEVSDDERLDQKCSYCGKMESICGGDHGDDMRWEQQEYRRRRY